jgi:monoamine oxidase
VDVPHGPAPASVVDETLGFLDAWMPGASDAYAGGAWLDSWVDDPWVRGSYAAFLPGQWTSYFGYLGLASGNVHFAGEHTSTYSQGYLNGGVESGLRAAREVLRSTGRA